MIASENLISPLAREMMVTDLHNRYAEGLPGERYYQGNEFVDLIELKVQELAKKLFKSNYADVRPISGTNANMAVLFALTKPGDRITVPGVSAGAHISSAKFGAVGLRGLEPVEYPFDVEEMNLDIDGTIHTILETKPKLALFGQSVYLFPTPLKEFQDAFQEAGSHVW
jgi:glycine hydroxymethyltransferase